MASPLPALDFPHFPAPDFPHFPAPPPPAVKPPPPPRTIPPPPPHIIPPPPPSSPHHGGSTVIIIIFVSCGGLLLLAFLAIALFCIIIKKKKKKKKEKEKVQETDIVHVHEHLKVKEAVVKGPRGTEVVTLAIDDDVHVDEEIRKEEKFKGTHAKLKSADDNPSAIEEGVSTSHSSQHHLGPEP